MKKHGLQVNYFESIKDRHLSPAVKSTQEKRVDIDKSLFEQALKRVPSGGNSQPFKWSWHGQVLEIEHLPEFAEHYLNRKNHTSWLTLGCLIYSVEIVAHASGLKIKTDISMDTLHTKITFSSQDGVMNKKDLSALLKRSTYREGFVRSLSPVQADLNRIDNAIIGVHIADSYILTQEFHNYLKEASQYLWLQTRATVDFFKEIRFFSQLTNQEARGIRSQDLGANAMDEIILYFFSFFPKVLSFLVRHTPIRRIFDANTNRSLENAHYVLITSQKLDSMSLLHVGRQAMKTWLQLEDLGFGVQPYSVASIPIYDALTGALPEDTHPHFKHIFHEVGPEVLQYQFRLNADEKPVWLFRIGRKTWKR